MKFNMLDDLINFYHIIQNETKYSKIEEVIPKYVDEKYISLYLELSNEILIKKRQKQRYILNMMNDIVSKYGLITREKLRDENSCELVISSSNNYFNEIVVHYICNSNDMKDVCLNNDTCDLIDYLKKKPFESVWSVLTFTEINIFDLYYEGNICDFYSLRFFALFYNLYNIYDYLTSIANFQDTHYMLFFIGIISDNYELFSQNVQYIEYKQDYNDLIFYSHSYNIISMINPSISIEIIILSLLNLNFTLINSNEVDFANDTQFVYTILVYLNKNNNSLEYALYKLSPESRQIFESFIISSGMEYLLMCYHVLEFFYHFKFYNYIEDESVSNVIQIRGNTFNGFTQKFWLLFDFILYHINSVSLYKMFDEITIENFVFPVLKNVKSISNLSYMFYECAKLVYCDLSEFDTSSIKKMDLMFYSCHKLKKITFSKLFSTINVVDMSCMFADCSNINNLNLISFDTSNVKDMTSMFDGCIKLEKITFSELFTTNNVVNITAMFRKCLSLVYIDTTHFNFSNVLSISQMFENCHKLEKIRIPQIKAKQINESDNIFTNCYNLSSFDLSSIDINDKHTLDIITKGCTNIKTIIVSTEEQKNQINTFRPDLNVIIQIN